MNKKEILELLLKLLEDCEVTVNLDNMKMYDDSPDYVVDHDLLTNNIKEELTLKP